MTNRYETQCTYESPAKESLQKIDGCIFSNRSFLRSRKALRSGAEKFTKTLRSVRDTFGSLSQRFRMRNHRRHLLNETYSPCHSPSTPSRKKMLGRTPAKLYSPFGIETPHHPDHRISPYMPDTPEHHYSPRQKVVASWHVLAKKRPRALFR